MEVFKTILTAFLGSLGFAILYGLRKRHMLFASIGGLISWSTYLLFSFLLSGEGIFIPCFLATFITAIYVSFISAKIKAPTLLFLLPALIPLVPGSSLYYTFYYFYRQEWNEMFNFAGKTFSFVFAIAAGMSVVLLLKAFKNTMTDRRKNNEQHK